MAFPLQNCELNYTLTKELDIARFINHMVTWDDRQWKVSPGTLITALVINILVHRRPLYRVERFYEAMDMPLLFEEDIQAAHCRMKCNTKK